MKKQLKINESEEDKKSKFERERGGEVIKKNALEFGKKRKGKEMSIYAAGGDLNE